jgi:hypothetical protein
MTELIFNTRVIVHVRRTWSQPLLKVADVKEITTNGNGSGQDGGTTAGMMMDSDARLKTRVERAGASPSGLPIYKFEYIWGGPIRVGVMAQDLLRLRPDAVHKTGLGFYRVDYSRIDVVPLELAA